MQSRLVTLDETIAYLANGTKSLPIPRNRFIQQIMIRGKITGDTDAAVTPNEDLAAAIAKKVRLVANGSDHLVNLSAADIWRMNKYRFGAANKNSLISTASQSNVELGWFFITLDFRLDQNEPLDLRALLPAHMMSSLNLFIDWGSGSDLGGSGDYTVDDVELKVTIKEFDLSAEEVKGIGSLVKITESSIDGALITAGHSDFTYNVDTIPVGKVIPCIGLVTIDNSIRTEGIISAFKLHDGRINQDIINQDWYHSKAQDADQYRLGYTNLETGFTMIDIEQLGYLDTTRAKVGDIVLKSKTGTPTGTAKVRLIIRELG